MTTLDGIPAEILLKISNFLSFEDYLYLSEVSVKINNCLSYGRYNASEGENKRLKIVTLLKDQLFRVKYFGPAIEYIENPSHKIQLAAVSETGYAIRYCRDPSEDVQLAAVKNFSCSIRLIDNPSEEVQFAAVKKSKQSITYIKNPTKRVKIFVESLMPVFYDYFDDYFDI